MKGVELLLRVETERITLLRSVFVMSCDLLNVQTDCRMDICLSQTLNYALENDVETWMQSHLMQTQYETWRMSVDQIVKQWIQDSPLYNVADVAHATGATSKLRRSERIQQKLERSNGRV